MACINSLFAIAAMKENLGCNFNSHTRDKTRLYENVNYSVFPRTKSMSDVTSDMSIVPS